MTLLRKMNHLTFNEYPGNFNNDTSAILTFRVGIYIFY